MVVFLVMVIQSMTRSWRMAKKYMSQAEFSRYRGVSRATVTEYKKKGLLVFLEDGRVDVAASEARLDSSLDPTRGGDRSPRDGKPSAKDSSSELAKEKINELRLKNEKQSLEVERLAGRLIEKDPTAMAAFTLARNALESLLAIPDRLASLVAAETDEAKVHELMTEEIREVANELAEKAEGMFHG